MQDLVDRLSALLLEKRLTLATAESCTGGLLSSLITSRPGSSSLFERGFVTYSNEAKIEMLGVPNETIKRHGAVSEETARAMAQGALKNSRADIAISITGIAGPDGGSEDKPVGLVWFGLAKKGKNAQTYKHVFKGNRNDVRNESARKALEILTEALSDE